jgi:hypothetical protein
MCILLQDMLFSLLPAYPPGSPRGSHLPRPGFKYALRMLVFGLNVAVAYFTRTFLGCVISLVSPDGGGGVGVGWGVGG